MPRSPHRELMKEFSYSEMIKATENFSKENRLGEGGNGEVCMGTLDDGTQVAVKYPIRGANKHFTDEIKILELVKKHPRIVEFLGTCVHPDKPCIVYEYMPKGSLYDHLHHYGHPHPLFVERLAIAYQVSEALDYLHNYSVPRILHLDVKSENILLDDDFNAKLSDFGHSKTIELGKSHISIPHEGTPHLIDPNWKKTGKVTDKSDVRSIGILMAELLTSKKTKDEAIFKKDKDGLILALEEKKLMAKVDPGLKKGMGEVELKQMMEMVSLAVECTSDLIEDRPSMERVKEWLQCIMNLDGKFPSHAYSL